jgi:copper chaperone
MAVVALLFSSSAMAKEGLETAKIKTNPHCQDCKVKIEKALKAVDGVKEAKLNMKDNVVTVKYASDKTTKETLSKTILDLGFKADAAEPANPHKACSADEMKSCPAGKTMKAGSCCMPKAKAETKTTEKSAK